MVKDALFNEETKRKKVVGDQSNAFINEDWGRQRGSNQARGRGKSKSRGKFTDKRKSSYKCYHCRLEGHLKKNYNKLLCEQANNNNKPKKDNEALVTVIKDAGICYTNQEEHAYTPQIKMSSG